MDRDELLRQMNTTYFQPAIYVEAEVNSTNSYAKRLLQNGLSTDAIIIAEKQQEGKGRVDRVWYSPIGGVYMTLVLQREAEPRMYPLFSFVLALSISRVIEQMTAIHIDLKWPNDILVAGKKIGGILSELVTTESGAPVILLGAGINLNTKRDEFPDALSNIATSVFSEIGESLPLETVIAQIVNSMDSYLIRDRMLTSIIPQYRTKCITIGKRVSIRLERDSFVGQAIDLTVDGSLLIRDESGKEKIISAGEVIHLEGD